MDGSDKIEQLEENEPTWWEIIKACWGLVLLVISTLSLVTAAGYYFAGNERDIANTAFYLAVSVWCEYRSDSFTPPTE